MKGSHAALLAIGTGVAGVVIGTLAGGAIVGVVASSLKKADFRSELKKLGGDQQPSATCDRVLRRALLRIQDRAT